MYESDEYFFQALNAGASGYVLKKVASADLVAAIRTVHGGEKFTRSVVITDEVVAFLQQLSDRLG